MRRGKRRVKPGTIRKWDERKEAMKTLAYFYEQCGYPWTSIRDTLPQFLYALEIEPRNHSKSDLIIECYHKILEIGVHVPANYNVPWEKGLPYMRFSGRMY